MANDGHKPFYKNWKIVWGLFTVPAVALVIVPIFVALFSSAPQSSSGKPTATNQPTTEQEHDTFRRVCKALLKSKLTQPDTFDPHYFMSGGPQQDGRGHWSWTLLFDASNAFGSVGHYAGYCYQSTNGLVEASIQEQ